MRFRNIVSRSDFMKLPQLPLPFHVRSLGHYALGMDYRRGSTGNEGFVEVFWGVAGEGELIIAGETFLLTPGDVVWKLTDEPHGYNPVAADWELRWFTFDGDGADGFMLGYGYPRRIAGAGPCPVELFMELEREVRRMVPYAQRRMVAVVAEILALAGRRMEGNGEAERLCRRFIELAEQNCANVNANVITLADMLNVHRSTLSRHFKAVMQMTPGDYLCLLRMNRALSLLRETDMPIAAVAADVGMPDPSHFSNAVKRVTGKSPSQLRRHDDWVSGE